MYYFFKRPYKPPPSGWSRRPLTYWDCCQFACNDSPTIGWVLNVKVIDTDKLASALHRAIQRRAPWLRGRLAKTESGSPPYEIHVPPEESDVVAFVTSMTTTEQKLNSVISYVPNGTREPVVDVLDTYDPTILSPRTAVTGVEEYISKSLPLLHLHFLKATDAILVSLAWSHAVMDGLGFAQIVKAWEEELNGFEATVFKNPGPVSVFGFTEDVVVPPGWLPPGWMKPTAWDHIRLFIPILLEMYSNKIPPLDGSIFIPAALIEHWRREAEEEFSKDEWVSRNDLVTAWIFKYTFSMFPDNDWNTLFNSICFRGRHPQLPGHTITNTAKSYVAPPITTRQLNESSLGQLALHLRKALQVYDHPDSVARTVAHEYRTMRESNGKAVYLPLGRAEARVCGATSWAKLGLSSPSFGNGVVVISCLTFATGRRCVTVIDSEMGDWRVDCRLSRSAWDCIEAQMEKEKKDLCRG